MTVSIEETTTMNRRDKKAAWSYARYTFMAMIAYAIVVALILNPSI